MNYFFPQVEDDYVGRERSAYHLHMALAVACVPFYILFDKFGFVTMPFVFFMTMRPRSCYLLPLIIHFAYGIQCRYAFCLACFLFVLFNHNVLVRYRLHWFYLLYLAIAPFFIWFTVTKFKDVQNYISMSGNVSGINTYFMFSGVFWGFIAITKFGKSFTRHFVLWNLFLLGLVSLFGTEGNRFFSRQIFWAIPFLGAFTVYRLANHDKKIKGGLLVAMAGVLMYALNFAGILRYKVTFTHLGLLLLSSVYVFGAMKHKRWVSVVLNPKILFVASFIVVMISADLVMKYRGINADKGEYGEISNMSLDSLLAKLQMKAIDDRASLWALSLERIKEIWHTNPVFVDTAYVFTVETDLLDENMKRQEITIDIPSHNIMLELLRSFGFYGGLGLYILYLCIFISPRNMKIFKMVRDPACLTICAVCVTQGVIGGHTGQYVIQTELGPVIFVLIGACWRHLAMMQTNFGQLPFTRG